jgi:hypothetical protein
VRSGYVISREEWNELRKHQSEEELRKHYLTPDESEESTRAFEEQARVREERERTIFAAAQMILKSSTSHPWEQKDDPEMLAYLSALACVIRDFPNLKGADFWREVDRREIKIGFKRCAYSDHETAYRRATPRWKNRMAKAKGAAKKLLGMLPEK